MPEFTRRGLRLHYEERGEGSPMLFLHGMGGSHHQVFAALDPFLGIRTIAPDMQGHGESEVSWDDYGFDALADDVAALCDHLHIRSFCLGGISLGASVAIALALRHPGRVRALFLARPAWTDEPMAPDIRRLYATCAQYLEANDRKGFLRTPEYVSVRAVSAYTAGALTSFFDDPASLRHFRKFLLLPGSAPYRAADLEQLQVGYTHIVACANDLIHPMSAAEFHRGRIPDALLMEIPDKDSDPARHRARLNDCVTDWLEAEDGV